MKIVMKTIHDYKTLEQLKQEKIDELSQKCNETILGRFTVNLNGADYQFSNDVEAQTNFDKADRAFEKGWIDEVVWTAYDIDGNVVRLPLNHEQFEKVYMASLEHTQSNIAKFRDFLQPLVEDAKTREEVLSIHW